METLVADLKECRAEGIDTKVTHYLAGYSTMNANQQKVHSMWCIKLMHACQAVIERLSEPQRASAVKAVTHCYGCIGKLSHIVDLKDVLTVAKIAYHITSKLLNLGDLKTALSCSDCIRGELLRCATKAMPDESDNIAQNVSTALWNHGRTALSASSMPGCTPAEHTDKITLAAFLLGRSLCFAAMVRSVDCQLLVANLERITNKVTQGVLTHGASLDPQIAFCIATALYSDICALPWLSVKPCLRVLSCMQSTAFLVQCGKSAEALTCLDPRSWGLVPQEAQQMCPVVTSAWAAMTAGLRLYSLVASGKLMSLHCLADPTQERKHSGSGSPDDLTAALDAFCSVARPVGSTSEHLFSGDDDKLLLCMAIVEPVRLLLETLRNKLSLQTPLRERCFFPRQPFVMLISSFLNVLRLYHNLLLVKLDLSSHLPCPQSAPLSGSELRRILVNRLQQATKTATLSAGFLLDALVLVDTHRPAAVTVTGITPEPHVTSASVHMAIGHLASWLETSAAKEPEISKEFSYMATIIHNSGVRLLSTQQLDDAIQLLQISMRMYKICYHAKGGSDNQEKWRSSVLSLSECYQRNGSWAAALKLTSELFSAGVTADECIQVWTGVKRCCVKQSALVATDEGLSSVKAPKTVTSVLTTTMREALTMHQPDVSESKIVDVLLSELMSYIVCSYTSKSCSSSFLLAEVAVIKDLLLSHAVTGCNRAFVLLRHVQLRQVIPATLIQFDASNHERLCIEECEAALSTLFGDVSSDTVDDLTALAYFLGHAIQHPLPTITSVPDVGRSPKKDTGTKVGQLYEDLAANTRTTPRRLEQQPVRSQHCTSLNLLDLAVGSWKKCFTNGRTVFNELVTLSCLSDAASIFALHDMPVQELECWLLVERALRQRTSGHTNGSAAADSPPEWRHEQQALALARLVSVSVRLGMLDDAAEHMNRLRSLNSLSISLKVTCHVGDRVSSVASLSEAEWLLASGRVEEAVSKADGVLSLMDSKAKSLTPSRCLYSGAASRLLAAAGSEHAVVCLPRGISVLEHADEAVRMHSSLYGFVAGKQDFNVNAFGCTSVAMGDVSYAIAARELLVSLDRSSVVHLLVEDVRAVRCYSREGLGLSRISLPLRAVSFLLHLSRTDSLCGAHSDCQVRLGTAARLLNAVASEGSYSGVTSSGHPDMVIASRRGSPGLADVTSERLICTHCNGQLAERLHQSVASEGSNDSDESFIRSKPLNVTGLGVPASGIVSDDEYDICTSPRASWAGNSVDLSKDPTASPRLVRRSRPPDGLVAAAEHSPSCSCTWCGGNACGGRLVGLLERLVMHGVRQAEAALAESEFDAAVNFARGALRAVEHYAAKADRWSAVDLSPSGARLAAEVLFAAPAIAAGRVLLESAMSLSCAYDAALADWKKVIRRNAIGRLADLYLSRLAEAEVLICLMSIASHLVPVLRTKSSFLSAAEPAVNGTTAACTNVAFGALSPCSVAQCTVVVAPRQKVQKSRLKKAIHFDDSEVQSEDVHTDDAGKPADTTGCTDDYLKTAVKVVSTMQGVAAAGGRSVHRSLTAGAKGTVSFEAGAIATHATTPLQQLSLNLELVGSNESTSRRKRTGRIPPSTSTVEQPGGTVNTTGKQSLSAKTDQPQICQFSVFLDGSENKPQSPADVCSSTISNIGRSGNAILKDSCLSRHQDVTMQAASAPSMSLRRGRSRVKQDTSLPQLQQQSQTSSENGSYHLAESATKPPTGRQSRTLKRAAAAGTTNLEALRTAENDCESGNMAAQIRRPPDSSKADIASVTVPTVNSSSKIILGGCDMFSTVHMVGSRDRRSTSDHQDAKQVPLLRKDALDATGDHERPGFGVQSLSRHVPTSKRAGQRQGRKGRALSPSDNTVTGESKVLHRHAEENIVPSVSCLSGCIAAVCRQLEDLLLKFRHFPPVAAYRAANLSLAVAYHHFGNDNRSARHLCESMALTFRYAAQRNYARKQRKAARIAGSSPEWKILQLSRCYELNQFGTLDLSFDSAMERLPEGWTVCQLSVVQFPHCVDGCEVSALYITRLQRGKTPVVCLIPNFDSIGKELVDEFADIMTGSTESMLLSDYKAWWAERTQLDQRMERLVRRLEQQLLGCWKGALLGSPREATTVTMEGSATRLPALEDLRLQFMSVTGLSELHFQVFLDGAATCSKEEVLYSLTRLVPRTAESGQEDVDSLGSAVEELADRLAATAISLSFEASSERYPTLLVIDKKLQHLPWESMPVLRAKSVSRIPSLSFIGTHLTYHSLDIQSVTTVGVDCRKVYYVLNPDGNLLKTEETFKSWFESEKEWSGVVGQEPSGQQLTAALTEADVFLYCGHGSGSKYLDGESIQTLSCRPVSILMGCSSGALLARGSLDATGVVQNYLMGGCPCVIANLWDVTDRDIDRFLTALLRRWLISDPAIADSSACSPLSVIDQQNLLACVGNARQACKLRYMIGASPVVYGLPVARKLLT